MQKERRDAREWVDVVPAVQWALTTSYRERYASPPYYVMFGRASFTSSSNLASSTGEKRKVDALDEKALRRKVANVVEGQQGLHKVVEERVRKTAKGKGRLASRGQRWWGIM